MLMPIKKMDEDIVKNAQQNLSLAQTRAINDLLRNAGSRGLNYAEKGFRQKLIDILYKLDYYKCNKTIFYNE